MKFGRGQFVKEPRPLRQQVSFSACLILIIFQFCNSSHLNSSDFENKFVCGEIMSYADLQEHGSESAVKAAGKLRQQGKPYESTSTTHRFIFCDIN